MTRIGWLRSASLALMILALPACVATTVAARRISLGGDSDRVVTQPAKAQLIDGSIVIFREGFRVDDGRLLGAGWRYDPTLRDSISVSAIPVDVAIILSMAAGCGPRINSFELDPAKPGGADGQLIMNGRHVRGELLEVSDTALVLRTRDAIVLIPKFAIDESNFRALDLHRGAELTGDVLEQHRLMSRFPMGMPPEALRSLLRQTGQSELKVITQ